MQRGRDWVDLTQYYLYNFLAGKKGTVDQEAPRTSQICVKLRAYIAIRRSLLIRQKGFYIPLLRQVIVTEDVSADDEKVFLKAHQLAEM